MKRNKLEQGAVQQPTIQDTSISMSTENIEEFLRELAQKGRTPETIERYRRNLDRLAGTLDDGCIRRGTLEKSRERLLDAGYAPRTVNVDISAANSFVAFMGHREFQLLNALAAKNTLPPELSRNEYIHLLQTAKLLQREKVYLLVKVFANADLPVQELDDITVQAVRSGQIIIGEGKGRRSIRIPRCITQELLSYAERNRIQEGPLFLTKGSRTPMDRTSVTSAIRELCAVAKVPVEKGNPRCLRRLYLARRKAIEDNIALLVEQTLERQVEEEQLSVGWEE